MDNIARGINLAGSTVSAQDDAFLYHMISGSNGVFNYRSRLECTTVSANLIRIGDGMAQVQGRNYIVYPEATVELSVDSGSQGMKRRDIVVVEFSKEENEELMELKIVKGEEVEGNPTDPELIQTDTLESGICYQMPLYRININGINLEGIDDLREYIPSLESAEGGMFYLAEGTGYINVGNYSEWLAQGSPKFGSDVSTASLHASTSSLDEEAMDDSQHLDAEGKENDDENNE